MKKKEEENHYPRMKLVDKKKGENYFLHYARS